MEAKLSYSCSSCVFVCRGTCDETMDMCCIRGGMFGEAEEGGISGPVGGECARWHVCLNVAFLSETDGSGGLGQDQSDSMHRDPPPRLLLKPSNTHLYMHIIQEYYCWRHQALWVI